MAQMRHKGDNLVLRLLVQVLIANDSAFSHFGTLQLELWFDQRENHSSRGYQVECVRQN